VRHKFIELPTRFSLNDYDDGGRYVFLGTRDLIKNFPKILLKPEKFIGILFHHYTLKQKEHFIELEKFLKFLNTLQKNNLVKFVLFSDLLV